MSQTAHGDIERGNDADGDQTQSALNQPSQGESNFGDSSGPLFSIFSKAAEEQDNKMVERWQKDADGILIFTGLFSAAVAALLAVTVQDLRPNSQDTSAFYLGNIYEVLADPNATRASITSPVARPPPFSPPRYAVWVNSLWFLSLVISVSCALLATSLHQWARRYARLTQLARRSPEKRARMRAFLANGVDKMHIPWAVEGLPTMLHLSLFLFFAGLVIFLFNVDKEVFTCVVAWIGLFSVVYGLITLLPLIRQDSPYYTPLSMTTWFLYTSISYLTFKVLVLIDTLIYIIMKHYGVIIPSATFFAYWRDRYRGWMLWGVEKKAEEMALEQSSEIDGRILGWTISALGDDDSLEKFFEAIPGFFASKLVKDLERDLPERVIFMFWRALDGLMGRTSSSNSVTESVKSRRIIICRDVMRMIPFPFKEYAFKDMSNNLYSHFNQAPVSMKWLQVMARWRSHKRDYVADHAQVIVAKDLVRMQERDEDWIAFTSDLYGFAADDLRDNIAIAPGGDSVLLATMTDISRRAIHSRRDEGWIITLIGASDYYKLDLVEELIRFDIHRTLPGLQHDFCTLWNEIVQKARNKERYRTSMGILNKIRRHYIALHQGTDSAPTAFSASVTSFDNRLLLPSSYPLCNIASHRPDSTGAHHITNSHADSISTQSDDLPDTPSYHPTSNGSTISQQDEEEHIVGPASPSNPTTPSKIGGSSQAPATTSPSLPVHTSLYLTDSPPPSAITAVLQHVPPAATLSHHLERTTQRDMVTLSTPAPTRPLAPLPAPTLPVLHKPLTSCNAGAASTSKHFGNPFREPESLVSLSIPYLPPLSRVSPLPNVEFLPLLSGTTSSRPTGDSAVPHIRARGLVNTGSMCFVNAVLQLLVHSPPFWNLFRELGDLKGQRGAGIQETGGGATPLVDATMRFFEEFMFKKEPPQQSAGRKPREDEEAKKEHNFVDSSEPMYLYDAMKDKRQLKKLLDGHHQDAEEFFCLYLEALDEELLTLLASTSGRESATAAPGIGEREVSQSGQADVGKQGLKVESPLTRICGGKFRLTVRAPNQPDTVSVEDWRSLQLNIQPDSVHTIQDSLVHISQPQPLGDGQSGSTEASHQVQVEALPSVLVLHLKRFLYDSTEDGIVKISKFVQFRPKLEIPLEIMAPTAGKSVEPARYKLYGVLYHHGDSASGGHYTVDVLHPNRIGSGEAWLHIDDEAVSNVWHEDVFGGHDNEREDNRCAYMLFYCRTASSQT